MNKNKISPRGHSATFLSTPLAQLPPTGFGFRRHVIVLSLLVSAVLTFGCATTQLDRTAKTLATTVQTVDLAMQGYATAVALDAVSLADQAKVEKLYGSYQGAVAIVEVAITTAIKSGHQGNLAATREALTAARDPLLAFLARFTTSPPSP